MTGEKEVRPYSQNSARQAANHGMRRLSAIIKAVGLTIWLAAFLSGVAPAARSQTALSFVTSQGVQLYDLT
jgi:hypothetical protein